MNKIIFVLCCFSCLFVYGQKTPQSASPYSVNRVIEMPATGLGFGLSIFGYNRLAEHSRLSSSYVQQLDPANINAFDRAVLKFPVSGYQQATKASDYMLNATVLLPSLLLFKDDIRRDWKDFVTLYFQSHLAGSALYLSMAYPIRRARPLTYNQSLSLADRTGVNTGNSFFSGHTASTATATFFMVKVLSDYNYLSGSQRVWAYSLAAIPPALVGYYRVAAGKHFRTDVMLGFALGALTGILVPQLHKKKTRKLSAIPIYNNNMRGIYVQYKIGK